MRRCGVLRSFVLAVAIGCSSTPPPPIDAATDTTPAICVDARSHSDLTWLQANVFTPQCVFSGCHDGANNAAGRMDLRAAMARAHLVNVVSDLDPTRQLVVPGDAGKSYLLVMIGEILPQNADPPAAPIRGDIGTMPQGSTPLCIEKRDAIQRWVVAGALDN
jgi:hypothetical protein